VGSPEEEKEEASDDECCGPHGILIMGETEVPSVLGFPVATRKAAGRRRRASIAA